MVFWAVGPSQEPELIAETEGLNLYGLASIPEEKRFYWQSETMLYGYEQDKVQMIRSVPSVHWADFALIADGKYIIGSDRGIGSFDLSSRSESTLTIKGWYNLLDEMDFLSAHPDIALMRQVGPVCAQDAYTDILMGDSSTDLYFIPYTSGLRKMMEQGYVEPLTGSETLMQDHERLYATLQEPLMHQGQLYAVPVQVEYGSWVLTVDDPEAFDMPQTLPEMLELLASWEDHEANVGQCCLGLPTEYREWTALDWLDMALYQLLLPCGEDEKPDVAHCEELLEIMELVKRSYKEARLPLLPEDAKRFSYNEPAAIMAYGGTAGLYGIALGTLNDDDPGVSQPALFDGVEDRYPAIMMVYILNPLSQRKEEAMTYLEWLAQHRTVQDTAWLQQDSEPTLREHVKERLPELPAEEQRKDLLNWMSWLVYEPSLRFYREEILPRLTVLDNPLLESQRITTQPVYPELLAQMTRYLMDTQSAEQCLAQMQRIIDTWWLEGQ